MEADTLRIVVAHGDARIRDEIVTALKATHRVTATCEGAGCLRKTVREGRPDLIVTGIDFPDGDGIETVIELGQDNPIPSVIVTARRSLDMVEKAMDDHVMAYLIEPVTAEGLEAAIVVATSRFAQLEELAGQVEDLREALAHRKVIERAKGMLMALESMSEGEAFATLRRRAQDARKRIVDVANDVLDKAAQA